jgi:hypothetical protein
MARVLIQPRHHLFVPLRWIVNGVADPIELAYVAAILGYGSN